MGEHLSALELDEAAAGLTPPEAAHLQACAECQQKVASLKAAGELLRQKPVFAARLAEVLQQAKAQEARSAPAVVADEELSVSVRAVKALRSGPARWLVPAFALAAGFAAFVLWPAPHSDDGVRLKGAPTVQVLGADGKPTERVKAGEKVTLTVGGAGRPQGLVLSLDASGEIDVVWPPQATHSAPVPAGASARLEPPFEVTPGNVRLYAFFSDGPFELGAARVWVEDAVQTARTAGQSPLQALVTSPSVTVGTLLLQVDP